MHPGPNLSLCVQTVFTGKGRPINTELAFFVPGNPITSTLYVLMQFPGTGRITIFEGISVFPAAWEAQRAGCVITFRVPRKGLIQAHTNLP